MSLRWWFAYPTLCLFGAAFGAILTYWFSHGFPADVGANLLVGIATVFLGIVAWVQLRRFNDNARVENTLRLFEAYLVKRAAFETHLTPAEAIGIVVTYGGTEQAARSYRQRFTNATSRQNTERGELDELRQAGRATVIAYDYFRMVAMLVYRDLADKRMVLDYFSDMAKYADSIEKIAFPGWNDFDNLRRLAGEARERPSGATLPGL
jgi:hypothetical protein